MSKQTLAAIEDGIGRAQLVEDGILETCLNCGYKVCRDDQEASFQQVSFGLWNMLGYSSETDFIEASRGLSTGAAYSEDDAERFRVSLAKQLARGGKYRLEYRLKKADGTALWVLESGRCIVRTVNDRILESMVVDITRQKELEEKLLRQDAYDSLTGIYNKKTFYQQADALLKEQVQRVFEVIYLDVERFKLINDLFGETVGNELLLYLAQCLRDICIEDCVYGRLQSDNFALCFPAENDNRERVIQEIQNKVKQFPLHYRIIVGFGVYQVTDRNLSVSSMCDRARMAFRQIQGKYMVSCGVYDERMRQRIVAEQEIVNEMERALSERQFEVYFQPKYDLGTENIRGAEALVRWRHPTKGMMPPAEFIPVFERNGFIMKLDEYIWDSVCAFLRKSLDAGIEPLPISVNMSRFDLYNEKLCDILTGIIQKYDVDPKLLGLELTESAYMENPQQIIEITKKLQSHGFVILMDDFGSGYSSLNMLKDVMVDVLKIDMHFLDNEDDSGRGSNILNSVIRMAKWLQIPVIIEGVETKKQADFLRTTGCSCVQGYYYSRPVPLADYEKLLTKTERAKAQANASVKAEDVWNPSVQLGILFNSVNGSIGLYEFNDGVLEALRVNEGYFEMFGCDREDFSKSTRQYLEYIVEEDRPLVVTMLEEAANADGVARSRFRHYCKDGSLRWIHARCRAVVTDGDSKLFYIAMEDITELQNTSNELQAMFNNIPAGFGVYEIEADDIKIHLQSQGMKAVTGRNSKVGGRFSGEKLSAYISKGDMRRILQEARKAYQEQRTLRIKYPILWEDGTVHWVWIAANLVRDEASGRLMSYAVVHDVTDTHAAEGKLRVNEARVNIALEMADQEIWEYDIQSKKICVREAFLYEGGSRTKRISLAPQEIVARGLVHPNYINSYFEMYDRLVCGADMVEWIGPFKVYDGQYRWVHMRYKTIFDDMGKPLRAVGVYNDIAEKNAAVSDSLSAVTTREPSAGVVISALLNLTADAVEQVRSFHDLVTRCQKAASVDEFIAICAQPAATPEDAEKMQRVFNRDHLLAAYSSGQREFTVEWRGIDKAKKMQQVKTHAKIVADHDTRHLLAYFKIIVKPGYEPTRINCREKKIRGILS